MKRLLILLMALLLLAVPAMAEEFPADSSADVTAEEPADLTTTEEPAAQSAEEPALEPTEEPTSLAEDTIATEEDTVVSNDTIAQPDTAPDSSSEDDSSSSEEAAASSEEDLPVVQSFSTLSPDLLAADASGDGSAAMADVVTAVFGEYLHRTYTVTQYDSTGNVIATSTEYVPGLAGLDYAWIAGVSLFGLVLAGLLRMIGGLLRK
jgi:hypothetical protein